MGKAFFISAMQYCVDPCIFEFVHFFVSNRAFFVIIIYRQTSNISRTKSPNLHVSRLVL